LPRHDGARPQNSADAADPRGRGDRIGPLQALLKSFHLRRHVGKAAYAIGRVATFENPDFVIRLRALRVPHSAEWFVTGNALHENLCCQHVLRRFARGLCRRFDQATANNQNGNDREEADARSQKNRGRQKSNAPEMLTAFMGRLHRQTIRTKRFERRMPRAFRTVATTILICLASLRAVGLEDMLAIQHSSVVHLRLL
jgi:hypothetical protein